MAREPNNPSGGGSAPADPEGSAGGTGGQPDPGAGKAGGGASGGPGPQGGAGESVTPKGIDPSVLPPELRGRSEAELKFILNNMTQGYKKLTKEVEQLRSKGSAGEGGGSKNDPPPEPKEPAKPYEERILEDPEGVVAEIVQKRYGGVIQNLDSRTARQELALARQELEDFEDYETDVMELLDQSGAEKTFENIAGAYTMAVGQRALEERRQNRRQAQGMEGGGGAPPEQKEDTPQMTDLERQVARVQGLTDEEWVASRDTDPTTLIRVPTGSREEK